MVQGTRPWRQKHDERWRQGRDPPPSVPRADDGVLRHAPRSRHPLEARITSCPTPNACCSPARLQTPSLATAGAVGTLLAALRADPRQPKDLGAGREHPLWRSRRDGRGHGPGGASPTGRGPRDDRRHPARHPRSDLAAFHRLPSVMLNDTARCLPDRLGLERRAARADQVVVRRSQSFEFATGVSLAPAA